MLSLTGWGFPKVAPLLVQLPNALWKQLIIWNIRLWNFGLKRFRSCGNFLLCTTRLGGLLDANF